MEDEEEIYLYSWLDPKNAGKQYTEEEVRKELGPLRNADELVERLVSEGVCIPYVPSPDLDEEDIHLYPWLDPKNEGKQYTEEEAREWIGGIANADEYIRQLKEQGIVIITNEEKTEGIKQEFDHFKEDISLTSDERWRGNNINEKIVDDDGILTRDERLDQYYDEIQDEGYDVKGYNLVETMLDNINEIKNLIDTNFEGQKGKWADLNREIQQYTISSMEDLYTYMVESTLPAMDTVKKLTECLKERKELQIDLDKLEYSKYNLEIKLESLRKYHPGTYEETDGLYWDDYGEYRRNPRTVWMENPWIKYYEGQLSDILKDINKKKEQIELKSIEAEKLLNKVEEYSNQTIEFNEIFHSFG